MYAQVCIKQSIYSQYPKTLILLPCHTKKKLPTIYCLLPHIYLLFPPSLIFCTSKPFHLIAKRSRDFKILNFTRTRIKVPTF